MKVLSNISEGTHEDAVSKCVKKAISTRYVLVSIADDGSEMVDICTSAGMPIGVVTDEAEAGEEVNVDLLGCSRTLNIRAGGAISAGELLTIGESGTAVSMPTETGTYTCIGIAMTSASAGGCVEALTSLPCKYTV